MNLETFLSVAGGLVFVGGTVIGWVLVLQRRLHDLDKRVQRLEDTAVKAPNFIDALDKLREAIEHRMDAMERDLERLTRVVMVLADREGLSPGDYAEPNARARR